MVAGGPLGLWTGALPVLLSAVGAAWGAMYRLQGRSLELSAAEGVPLALRPGVEVLDLHRHVGLAACRAARTRRAVAGERMFAAALDARAAASFDAAGLTAGVALPISHAGTVFGVMIAGAPGLDADALLFLDGASTLLAPALALAEASPADGDARAAEPARQAREASGRGRAPREAAGEARRSSSSPPRGASEPPPRGPSDRPRGTSDRPRRTSDSPRSAPDGGRAPRRVEPEGERHQERARGSSRPPAQVVDAGRAAVEAVQQCTPFLRRLGIDVRVAAGEGLAVETGGSDLALAIAHLVTNGAEAAAERAPAVLSPSQPPCVRVAASREGATVVICVDDSGRGVPPDLRARVFETGFSTKGKNRGGGLALVRRIAMAAGGHVEVAVSDLGGASFRLLLPASVARPEQGTSGLWHTGATWPQMHASGREARTTGERGHGDDGESDPVTPALRRVAS